MKRFFWYDKIELGHEIESRRIFEDDFEKRGWTRGRLPSGGGSFTKMENPDTASQFLLIPN